MLKRAKNLNNIINWLFSFYRLTSESSDKSF